MRNPTSFVRAGAFGAAVLLVVSCGGGGSGSGGSNNVCVNGTLLGSATTDASGNYALNSLDANNAVVAISGQVQYQRVNHNAITHGLDYTSISTLPARGVTVQARRVSGGTQRICVRAETVKTDAGGGQPSWDIQIRDNTQGDAIYIVETADFTPSGPTVQNVLATTGWGVTSYTGPRMSAPFAILDSIYSAVQKALTADPAVDFPPLDVFWSINNTSANGNPNNGAIGTSYYYQDEIYILGDDGQDTDEFDDHVIIHEFGHFIEDNLSRSDSIGGSHSGGDLLDMRVAYGEGFGNAWSGIVTDDPVYQDSFGAANANGFDINVESDTLSASLLGWFSETSTAGIIYDLYDTTNEGGASADSGNVPFATLWGVWTGSQRTTPAMTSIHSFLDGVRDAAPGSAGLVNAIANGMDVHSTDEWGAGETDDGAVSVALPVYSVYTVGQGATQYCTSNEEGEYNALGNRQFLRLNIASSGTRTFSLTHPGNADPDGVLYLAGAEVKRSEVNGNESFSIALSAGTYVLEVYPWSNNDGSNSTGGTNVCVTVAIN